MDVLERWSQFGLNAFKDTMLLYFRKLPPLFGETSSQACEDGGFSDPIP